MLFLQFSNIIIYVKIVGKIPDQHLSVWLFSNPGDKVHILVESMGQICLVVLHIFWTLSHGFENNHAFKCWSGNFATILTNFIMLEICQNNISLYGCSPIQVKKFYLVKILWSQDLRMELKGDDYESCKSVILNKENWSMPWVINIHKLVIPMWSSLLHIELF